MLNKREREREKWLKEKNPQSDSNFYPSYVSVCVFFAEHWEWKKYNGGSKVEPAFSMIKDFRVLATWHCWVRIIFLSAPLSAPPTCIYIMHSIKIFTFSCVLCSCFFEIFFLIPLLSHCISNFINTLFFFFFLGRSIHYLAS